MSMLQYLLRQNHNVLVLFVGCLGRIFRWLNCAVVACYLGFVFLLYMGQVFALLFYIGDGPDLNKWTNLPNTCFDSLIKIIRKYLNEALL